MRVRLFCLLLVVPISSSLAGTQVSTRTQILQANPELKDAVKRGDEWRATAKKTLTISDAIPVAQNVCDALGTVRAIGSKTSVSIISKKGQVLASTRCVPSGDPSQPPSSTPTQTSPADTDVSFFLSLALLLLTVGGIAWLVVRSNAQEILKRKQLEYEVAERRRLAAENQHRFEQDIAADWPVSMSDHVGWEHRYLMMSADQCQLRLATVDFYPRIEVTSDQIIEVVSIVSVEIQRESHTIMRMDTQSVTKKNSPIARAVVGDVLFGPVGAVVGVASASSATVGSVTGEQQTIYGPTDLVIGTTDLHSPLWKVRMPDLQSAETWLHRIRGAITVCARRATDL